MNDKKKTDSLIRGTAIYGIGTFGSKILSFLIVPLYTYYISTEDMGTYDILLSTINLLTPIITLQISDAAYRWIIRDDGNGTLYIRSTMQVLIFNCAIAVILIAVCNQFFTILHCYYFCIILILSRVYQTIHKLLRALKNQKLFAISGLIYTGVFLTCNVIQICILQKGIVSLFQSLVIANIVAIIVIFMTEKRLRVNYFKMPDIGIIKKFYKYSIPLVPNYLNWWVVNSSDRYIVAFFLGASSNGILAIAHKFPTVLQTVLSLFTNSWQDFSVADTDTDVGKYYTGVFKKYYRFAFSFLWVLVPFTKIVILFVMSSAYKPACDFVAFYYLGTVFQSFATFYGVGYLKNKETGKAFSTSIYGAVINIAVNIMFIKLIGLQAAAVSTFIGFLIMWIIREKQNREELGIRVNWGEFIILMTITVIVCVVSIAVNKELNMVLLVLGGCVFMIYNKNDIKKISGVVIKRCRKNTSL